MTILASRLAKSINSCAVFGKERETRKKRFPVRENFYVELQNNARERKTTKKKHTGALNKVIPFEIQKNRCTDGGIYILDIVFQCSSSEPFIALNRLSTLLHINPLVIFTRYGYGLAPLENGRVWL